MKIVLNYAMSLDTLGGIGGEEGTGIEDPGINFHLWCTHKCILFIGN